MAEIRGRRWWRTWPTDSASRKAAIIGPELRKRLVDAGVPEDLVEPVAAEVEAGIAARYGGGGTPDASVVEGLVSKLERVGVGRVGAALVIVLCLAAGVPAQDGVAAYRAGDYAAASEAFAAAVEQRADAATLYNLGNALYRQGELGRALVAWERARIANPRDAEINANLALVRGKLGLGRGEGSRSSRRSLGCATASRRGRCCGSASACTCSPHSAWCSGGGAGRCAPSASLPSSAPSRSRSKSCGGARRGRRAASSSPIARNSSLNRDKAWKRC